MVFYVTMVSNNSFFIVKFTITIIPIHLVHLFLVWYIWHSNTDVMKYTMDDQILDNIT